MSANDDYSFFSVEEWNRIWVQVVYTVLDAKGLLKLALDYDDKKYFYAYVTDNLTYAVVGFSYLSADGDFKDIYINVNVAKKLCFSKEWKNHYTELEKEVVEYYNKKKVSIIAPKKVVDEGLEKFLLVLSNFMIYMNLHTKRGGIHEKNVHPFFKDNYPLQKLVFYFKNRDNEKGKKIYEYHQLFNEIKKKSDITNHNVPYGQKISPIKKKEIDNFKNPSYQLWRELLLNKYIHLLTFNNMTRGISCLHYYYFIKDDFSIYNNYLIFNKVFSEDERKPLEGEITLLSESLDSSKFSSSNDNKLKEKKKSKDEWVDVHLIQIFNNVGTTYFSRLMYALEEGKEPKHPVLFDYKQYKKYIFEFIWNFICLNKIGAVHGDCHLNNVTIQSHYPNREGDEREKFVKYAIEGETYIQPYKAIGTMIDFSRCWFFEENELEENLKLSSPFQIDQIINKYSSLFPDFIDEYEDKLRNALIDKHDEVLKIISCIDSYSVTDALEKLLISVYSEKKGKVNYNIDKQIRFIGKVNTYTRTIMVNELGEYLDGKRTAKQMGYPLHRIIQKSFRKNLEDPTQDYSNHHFIDYLSVDNGMKWRIKDVIEYGEKQKIISMKAFNSDYKRRMIDFTKYAKSAEVIATR